MSNSAHKRTNIVGFVAVLMLSSATMLWLLWHHPVTTAIVTIVVFAAFAISARLARMVDTDLSDREHQNQARF
jgi:cytochrome c-type biogenesis protein CcmH/NrfF